MKRGSRFEVRGSGEAFLTLGPLLFHWPAEKRRDFYFRIADEADVDCVYLGEVVCSKREPFFEPYRQAVIDRLRKAGKQVVLSTLALITAKGEIAALKGHRKAGFLIEANDVAAVETLAGKPFVVGPFINTINEGTRDFLISLGATRIVLPVELTAKAIGVLANDSANFTKARCVIPAKAGIQRPASAGRMSHAPRRRAALDSRFRGNDVSIEFEIQVFGRQPLSVAMRCYAARAHGLHKDGCRFSCGQYPDGLFAETLDGQKLLTINGTQILSHGYVVLLKELAALRAQGVTHFRLSPHDVDMVRVASLYRDVLDGKKEPKAVQTQLKKIVNAPFINGFLHGKEGLAWESN